VTDANVVLGYLPPSLLGGEMPLDKKLAHQAVQKIADAMGIGLYEAARGIIDIINENMFGALRLVTVQRGLDPRDFCLVAFGGAGPLHANDLARLTGSWPVIIPTTPGVLSALGFLHSDIRNEFSKTLIQTLDKIDHNLMKRTLLGLAAQAHEWLTGEGIPSDRQRIDYEVDVRYYRQGYEFPIAVDPSKFDTKVGMEELVANFKDVHERNYGFNIDSLIEIVNMRAIGVGLVRKVELPKFEGDGTDASHAQLEQHKIRYQGRFVDAPIYGRHLFRPGNIVHGPAIVTQADTTTVILPDHYGEVDSYLNILIRPNP
jgi:N-methylhydantoinase A